MSREELETWARQGWELAWRLANQLGQNSTTSSRPPSSNDPYRRDKKPEGGGAKNGDRRRAEQDRKADGETSALPAQPPANKNKVPRRPGKQPGAKGWWRTQPLEANRPDVEHCPAACDCCETPGAGRKTRQSSAHFVCDLDRGGKGLQIAVVEHVYFAITWSCGHETIAQPGVGLRSEIEGRKRNLQMSAAWLVRRHPTNARLEFFVFAEFFRKTGKTTFANSA
jgi:transposase